MRLEAGLVGGDKPLPGEEYGDREEARVRPEVDRKPRLVSDGDLGDTKVGHETHRTQRHCGKQPMTSADSLTWIWNVSRADGTHHHCDVGAVALCPHGAALTKGPCDLFSLVSVIWKHTEEESA